ncbi:MAG: hypothetical protein E6G97_22580 [Alphaproteobacteria bacterium]|nr:MAG: hypothetical protein E6G97_22580 [Alphaproteobacteria bacterium]
MAIALFERGSTVPWCRPFRPRPRGACCVTVSKPPERPDPAIYSQNQQIQAGQIPTWDSPDIVTNRFVPWTLHAETEVTVRNLSPLVAAVNTQVQLSVSAFGIGLSETPLSAQIVTLAPAAAMTLKFPLTQDILKGDQSIAVFVDLYHPNDLVAINSHGAQAISGFDTKSAGRHVTRHFPVANPTGAAQLISLAALPNNLAATVAPASHTFAPFEQISASLTVTVPAGMHNAEERVTVIAHGAGGSVVGGVTFVVTVND